MAQLSQAQLLSLLGTKAPKKQNKKIVGKNTKNIQTKNQPVKSATNNNVKTDSTGTAQSAAQGTAAQGTAAQAAKQPTPSNPANGAAVSSGFSVPERIWNFLCKEKSIGSITTAAIMGNIAQESNYNTKADSSAFDGNASIGLCQWTFGRKTALIDFAKSQGKDVSDVDVQLNFLWKELGERGDIGKTQAKSKGMPEGSKDQIYAKIKIETKAFCDVFEVPDPKWANYENRYNRAIEAYEKQGKGILAAGTYNPGDGAGAGFMGQASAAKRGTKVQSVAVEQVGHKDEYEVRPLDPDKTFCEPIYPDLTSIGDKVPEYLVPKGIPTSAMSPVDYQSGGAGLVYSLPTESMIEYSDNQDILQFCNVFNQKATEQRKEIFDLESHKKAVKESKNGKPPNNHDPFPVDLKIEELETHQPRCKIDMVNACRHSLEVAKALVLLSTDTEKRLVRLENNMSTIMRYLYRLAARMNINCVYYGGQTTYEKYNCIRCLKDDLCYEGAEVSLDQCLMCTRYEPLIGQVYDIFNDSGVGLSQILDAQQTSLGTMEEYYRFASKSVTQEELGDGTKFMNSKGVSTRNASEMDLNDLWGPGLKMDWTLYPVELQKPHINRQQSINKVLEGSLASNPAMNSGMAMTNGGTSANLLVEARNQIDGSDTNVKSSATEFITTKLDEVVAEVKASLGAKIRESLTSKNIQGGDSCLVASLMAVYGTQVEDTIDKLEQAKSSLKASGVDNIALSVMCFALEPRYVLGTGSDTTPPLRIDKVEGTPNNAGSGSSGSTSTDQSTPKRSILTKADTDTAASADTPTDTSGETSGNTIMPAGSWEKINTLNWNDWSGALAVNISGSQTTEFPEQMVNFAKVVYLYKELVGKCSASRFDTAEWGFPFTEEQITGGLGLNFSSGYKWRWGRMHNGIDIGVGSGTEAFKDGGSLSQNKGAEIHAAREGVVYAVYDIDGNGGGKRVYLRHDNGYTSWYMHMVNTAVKTNDKVNRGDVIGYTGGSGSSGQGIYPEHLHFEIHQPGEAASDPLQYYNGITMSNEGSQLSAINV